jgi:hypothetical protein
MQDNDPPSSPHRHGPRVALAVESRRPRLGHQEGTVHAIAQTENPEARHLPLVRLLIDTRAELTEFVVRSCMKVLEAMLEKDRAKPVMRTKPSAKPAAPAQPGVGVVLGVSESR